ncbi:diguanylate cyclase [Billgrantia antri]|uniref:diguanylate cyclase n=1 Tax=Halomonas sulfidivorans TaxID=2733488 RepID=A0ABX7WLK7_9GAMM|nr:diguanylate cyclase [Halomonas sulfidivorans]QTP60462.1 diguanylate cyclase [Halomonas sulfidivorans]
MPDSLERELDASVCPSAANATHGAIQPHGCLIGFDSDWRRVCLASTNLPRFFGLASTEALGCPLERVVGGGATVALERALALGSPGISLPARPASGALQRLHLSLHATGRLIILAAEPLEGTAHDLPGLGYAWGTRLAQADSTGELDARLQQALHALTGFEFCTLSQPKRAGPATEHLPGELSHSDYPPLWLVDSRAVPVELLAAPGINADLSDCPLHLPAPMLHRWLADRQARAALMLDLQAARPERRYAVCWDRRPRSLAPPLRHLLLQLVQTAALRRTLLDETQQTQQRYRLLSERNSRLQRLAYTDPLTQLANRHRIERVLETELALASRTDAPLAVLLFDIDHFKPINDTHGHETGDRVLSQVARQAQSHLRDSDHLGRWGGEEFIVVIPCCELSRARELAWRMCRALAQRRIDPVGQVTASFGVATSQPGDSCRTLVRRADQAMYLAKQAGRACVRTQEAG